MAGYNQYIGMRYVPLIYGAWVDSADFEPLTVVTYEGNSYISKTYVPAGTLPTNTTYWILSANYNAQVDQYRQEVAEYQQAVGDLSDAVEGFEDDLETASGELQDQIDVLKSGQVLLAEVVISLTSVGSTEPTYSAACTGTLDISSNTRVREFKRLKPSGTIVCATVETLEHYGYGCPYNTSTTVAESGTIAAENYSCVLSGSASIRNIMNIAEEISGTQRVLVIGVY